MMTTHPVTDPVIAIYYRCGTTFSGVSVQIVMVDLTSRPSGEVTWIKGPSSITTEGVVCMYHGSIVSTFHGTHIPTVY